MKRIIELDKYAGYRYVGGNPHGFNTVPVWRVEADYDSKEEAEKALQVLSNLDSSEHES